MSWIERLRRLCPVSRVAVELVRFDLQKEMQPEIAGVAYQQGELAGYEVREYLLEKWGRACAYCDKTAVPLQVEHIVAKANGGSDRVSNLTLACNACNQRKGKLSVETFLKKEPTRLKTLLARAKVPLRDAAAVNSTRWALFRALRATRLPVETASGGCTKYNRSRFRIPKAHALDALCVGQVDAVTDWNKPVLAISATGRGAYQRTRVTADGFKRGYLMRQKKVYGFRTGDLVEARVPSGKKRGIHTGRVAIRATGSFNVQTSAGVVQGISHRHCRMLQRGDGYGYVHRAGLLPALKGGVSAQEMTG